MAATQAKAEFKIPVKKAKKLKYQDSNDKQFSDCG